MSEHEEGTAINVEPLQYCQACRMMKPLRHAHRVPLEKLLETPLEQAVEKPIVADMDAAADPTTYDRAMERVNAHQVAKEGTATGAETPPEVTRLIADLDGEYNRDLIAHANGIRIERIFDRLQELTGYKVPPLSVAQETPQQPQHVCGLSGYNPMTDPSCPACDVRELSAPCRWCGYNGPNYWQAGTHAESCPWHHIGGMAERIDYFNEHSPVAQGTATAPACTPEGHFYRIGKLSCVCGDSFKSAVRMEWIPRWTKEQIEWHAAACEASWNQDPDPRQMWNVRAKMLRALSALLYSL